MAERRMFAKTIIDSDIFLDMPLSAQALYFHLSMRADDEGFINNPKKIQRMVGSSEDDLKLLVLKNFIIPFDSGVVVIKHWKIHNYIRGDRKKQTVFNEEVSMLTVNENGEYYLSNNQNLILNNNDSEETLRQKVYKESYLPYSFNYKIRQAFVGKKCPICNCTMSYANNLVKPTIQHNIPISKGGKHELGNISVICSSCNSSIQNEETNELNSKEVIEIWDKINEEKNVVSQMSDKCQTQDSIGKDSIELEYIKENRNNTINNIISLKEKKEPTKRFIKPTYEEVRDYVLEKGYTFSPDMFHSFYESKGWKVGNQTMKDWKACCRTWQHKQDTQSNSYQVPTIDKTTLKYEKMQEDAVVEENIDVVNEIERLRQEYLNQN